MRNEDRVSLDRRQTANGVLAAARGEVGPAGATPHPLPLDEPQHLEHDAPPHVAPDRVPGAVETIRAEEERGAEPAPQLRIRLAAPRRRVVPARPGLICPP